MMLAMSTEHPLPRYRNDAGITRQQMADRIGAPMSTIWRIEERQVSPSLPMIERIIAATDDALCADDFLSEAR
jgi:DNA-binding XRE family transcriptional regulator